MFSAILNRLEILVDRVAGARTTTFVLQGASILTNAGGFPLPNCLAEIVDVLSSLQQTVEETKALQVWRISVYCECHADSRDGYTERGGKAHK